MIIGRKDEKTILQQALNSTSAEFIAIYGRRRVGKTYLVREFFQPQAQIYFSITGLKDGTLEEQLQIFQEELEQIFFQGTRIPKISSWREGFKLLAGTLKREYELGKRGQFVVFFDELPWLSTPRSGLIQALDHVWNTEWAEFPNLRLIVCGSAASWMIDHLIHAKGGLHHRITRKIHLLPFNLSETEEYLKFLGIRLNHLQIVELYMALGGVAQYLKQVQKGHSAQQAISQICFSRNGYLSDEFNLLFQSLFDDSENHLKIITALSKKRFGLTRKELIEATGIPSGGRLGKWIEELEQTGFIAQFFPFEGKAKGIHFRIVDEYVWFYLKWIRQGLRGMDSETYWEQVAGTPAYQAWAGLAFELVCFKHVSQLKKALGIAGATLQTGIWSYTPAVGKPKDTGAQIDLVFDRSDGVITLGEVKFSNQKFVLDKAYALELKKQIQTFAEKTGTNKQLFLVMITSQGLKPSIWSEGLVDQVVTLDAFFG